MDLKTLITYSGPLTFLGLQCSNLSTGYKIWTHKSTFHYSIIPFYTLFINCVVWGIYGYLIHEFPIYGPNISGSIVGFLCTFVYQRYSPTRDLSMYLLGSVVVIASLIAGYLGNAQIVGGIGSILSVALMAAPLSVVTTVISERSTDALPFTSSLLLWFASLSWTLYGFIYLQDPLIYIPNGLGLVLSSFQMMLFVLYGLPNSKKLDGYSLP